MILTNALLRAVSVSLVAALFVAAWIAIAKWRDKPLSAVFEHALWTCVLAAMLAFAVPGITVHAGSPITQVVQGTKPAESITADVPAPSRPNPAPVPGAPVSFIQLWLVGAIFMALRILVGILLTHRSLAGSRAIRGEIRALVSQVADVAESDNAVVPMTVGWPQVRIILPTRWRSWPEDKLRAVMLHESAHVRRHDPLITFLAAINKAIFWFHPLAWWLERRLAELAEFAADDAALNGAAIDRRDYAAILLEIAANARPMRLRLSSDFARHGFHRINRRMDRIFDVRIRASSGRSIWAVATLIAALSLVRIERPVRAQQPDQLHFETASVKPAKAPKGVVVSGGMIAVAKGGGVQAPRNTGGPGTNDPGRIHYSLIDLKDLLRRAWGDSYFEITSPGWLDTQLVAIDATMPLDTTKEQFSEMLRNLIIDRFKLTFHVETKEISGYSLVVAKNGPKMKESPDQNGSAPGEPAPPTSRNADGFPILPPRTGAWCVSLSVPDDRHRLICQQQTMHDLARQLEHSTVTDSTGLTAKYDFTLTYAGGRPGSGPESPAEAILPEGATPMPDIFSAVQSQLGLKLEPKKITVNLMVVGHMEKVPTRN